MGAACCTAADTADRDRSKELKRHQSQSRDSDWRAVVALLDAPAPTAVSSATTAVSSDGTSRVATPRAATSPDHATTTPAALPGGIDDTCTTNHHDHPSEGGARPLPRPPSMQSKEKMQERARVVRAARLAAVPRPPPDDGSSATSISGQLRPFNVLAPQTAVVDEPAGLAATVPGFSGMMTSASLRGVLAAPSDPSSVTGQQRDDDAADESGEPAVQLYELSCNATGAEDAPVGAFVLPTSTRQEGD